MKKVIYPILLVAVTLTACSEEEAPILKAPPTARLLVAHASPSTSPSTDATPNNVEIYTADITFGNNNRRANLAYGAVAVTNPNAGDVFIKSRLNGAENVLLTGSFPAAPYENYTALLVNTDPADTDPDAAIGLTLLQDDLTAAGENAKLRLIHLGVGAPAVDVYFYLGDEQPDPVVTALGYAQSYPDKTSLTLVANDVSAPVEAGFAVAEAGKYNYKILPAGAAPDADPVLSGTVDLAAGRVYTLLVRGYLTPPDGAAGRGLAVQSILHERLAF